MSRLCGARAWVPLLLALLACSGSEGGGEGGDDGPDAGTMVEGGANGATFGAVFNDVIRGTGCNGGGLCHGGSMSVTTLTMRLQDQSYAALVNAPAMARNLTGMGVHCADSGLLRVVPFEPDQSLLVQKLEDTQTCGDRMPPTTEPLAPELIQLVRAWIENGALDD